MYYDSIAMFIFLVLLARRIELRGRLRAANALDRVGKILPRLARRLLADGDTITDTNSPTDIMDLISKYAFGDVGGEEE